MLKSVKCAVCGKESGHDFVKGANAFGAMDKDIRSPEMDPSILPYLIQRCPNCAYCSPDLSELIKGADEHLDSDEYRSQLTNEKFPELANSFLCAGILHECAEEYEKAGWDCLHAADICDDKENNDAAVYCRKRALSMFEEATESGQRFMGDEDKERLLLTDIARKAGLFEYAEEL